MKKYIGLPGAGGMAFSRAKVVRNNSVQIQKHYVDDTKKEVKRLLKVCHEYLQHLQIIHREALNSVDEDLAKSTLLYQKILNDDIFFNKIIKATHEQGINVDYAIAQEKQRLCQQLATTQKIYAQERTIDLINVCDELIGRLNGKSSESIYIKETKPFIIVADNLSPEDTFRFNRNLLKGLITEHGGVTSHLIIVAKSLEIPAVVGAKGILDGIHDRQFIYINGNEGYAIVEPDDTTKKELFP